MHPTTGQQHPPRRWARRQRGSVALALILLVASIPAIGAHTVSAGASTGPVVTALSPASGTASGGTAVTITGTGFVDGATVTVGGVNVPATFVSETQIDVTTPARATTAKSVGAQAVIVTVADESSNSDVTFTYRPELESPGTTRVWLHDLASRSQRQEIVRTQTAPFLVSGTDARTGEAYLYETDRLYSTTSGSDAAAYQRESDERASSFTGGGSLSTTDPNYNADVTSGELTALKSGGTCTSGNNFDSITTYCSIFGPEVYSETFYATVGQSLSFDWFAKFVSDDYEVYAFLVRVDDDSAIGGTEYVDLISGPAQGSAPGAASPAGKGPNAPGYQDYLDRHTLVMHGLGNKTPTFQTASAAIPADGLYRFRFVNGSYDATGGFVWGSEMYIRNVILVGTTNTISVPTLNDQVKDGATYTDYVFEVSSTSGAEVTVTPTGKCTSSNAFSGGITTVTVENSGGAGDCILAFSQGATGQFAPAQSITAKFAWLEAATVPQAPTITAITPGNESLNVAFLAPSGDGGAPITNYAYSIDNGANWAVRDPASTGSPLTITGLTNGTAYPVRIRAVNSVGQGTQSTAVSGTPSATAPAAPASVAVSAGNGSLVVTFVAPADGGSPITNYEARIDGGAWVAVDPASTSTVITLDGLTNGTTYSIEIRAVNVIGAGPASTSVTGTPLLPPPPAPTALVTPTPPPLPTAPVVNAAGTPPAPSATPTARVGERDVTVASTPAGTVRQEGTTTVSTATILDVGRVSLAMDVTGSGSVRTTDNQAPQVTVARDTVARTSGGGMLPDTQLAVWLPRNGTDVRQVTTLTVSADGTFSGALPFDGSGDRATDGRPLPIGRQVLQLVGIDESGELVVIEQTITITQPGPSPEPDRTAGAPPALTAGASIATNAGLPETVRVVPQPDVRRALIQADGWAMAVDVPSADGRVAPTADGGTLIELVADDLAEISGDGFLPGARADVWLFSTPTLLGSVTIGPAGSFSGQVEIDGELIDVGEHTLQLQGVGRDGYVRAANLGVVVVPAQSDADSTATDPAPDAPAEAPADGGSAGPADRVEVIAAADSETTGRTLRIVLLTLLTAALAAGGWWLIAARRRRDEEEVVA